MAANPELSTVQGEKCKTTADDTIDIEEPVEKKIKDEYLQGFFTVSLRGTLLEIPRTTITRSDFFRRLIQSPPNSKDGFYYIQRNAKPFECLMDYLVNNSVPDVLPCSVRDFYIEASFYGIDLPENDCWGTKLSYTLENINTYDIRGQLKSFADTHAIFGSVKWKKHITIDIEFHCHRTIDLKLVTEYMIDQMSRQIFAIQSTKESDARRPYSALFRCPKTYKEDRSSKSPPHTSSSTPSSSDSCPESAKGLLKQLTSEDVKTWLKQTMFHHLADTWFTYNVKGGELLHISKTGNMTNGRFMLSIYDLVRFRDILNRFGFELELELYFV